MCGLFGFSKYSKEPIQKLNSLTNALANESAVRGTDATGIAICTEKYIKVNKESKPAYKISFSHHETVKALIGHTRHATQGSVKNHNNHPFSGKAGDVNFVLAHNGVLMNDKELRHTLGLPKTKIETDSYIAVQIIESKKELTFDSLKYMAETVEGSFSFSLLDDKNNIYLVKGDSPITLLHFPEKKIYVYASTDNILYKAIIDSPLFKDIKMGSSEEIPIKEGEILKISSEGQLERGTFNYNQYYGRNWWSYGAYGGYDDYIDVNDKEYVDCLKNIVSHEGYNPEIIDELLEEGFTFDDIEEYIYGY